ncbi:hypothetical protein L873DRAFT_1695060 [Choiromyces venosus 120613-1]|uniref:Transcription factor Iwr1 domain-containing protein n=1 Tax=Choiromyces venosus 120613-1 TaxID=1336337 RepID=A0A3N4IVW7_9PEZI|nr:hypothetical protein L873DRAFT_1796312 [Choiromyces venosus 120613-1]RPA96224.1 hypothetical protein L873DRAFT_1695060 [Choiromyces venosus 120613-1]
MSLPPQTIRIKRPRDEAPVQALYIDGNTRTPQKRQRIGHSPDYVFLLAHTVTSPTDPTPRPFQPRTTSPPRRYGVPPVHSTLPSSSTTSEPGAVTSPTSPSTVSPLTPLTPRTSTTTTAATTPQTGEKLVLDTAKATASQIALLKAPVPLSAISSNRGSALESRTVDPLDSPPPSSPVQTPERHSTPRHDTFGNESPRAGGLTPVKRKNGEMEKGQGDENEGRSGTKRKITPVRRYQLAKRLRVKHSHHPYSSATRRSAIFTRVVETHDTNMDQAEDTSAVEVAPEPVVGRKRPRTHPQEKKRLEEQKKIAEEEKKAKGKEVKFKDQEEENDPLIAPFHAMVLEYLNSSSNDGIRNLPSSSLAKPATPASKIGGGVGGGTWDEPEEEDGFVYDVYIREELPASIDKKEGDYGVLVIEGSDDEEWWCEGDPDEGSDDVWASDDEDSNAEDFHTNDYPEEPTYDSDDDLPRQFNPSDDDSDDDPNVFRPWVRGGQRFGDEEFDLDDDDEYEADRFKIKRGIWDIIGGDDADDEGE